ncbi:hypothetical protein [Rhizobium mesosinicum]|uniref:Uncharacterized protein n=1 Tax=Rhizobium mesosinicum TaxID=335017 RepID=A0ABS7GT90_9HYPH|nr:hypothetical protein [Rhizobium mesosinicum]MBW9052434.1 hypothetical protein [Rhizobium mesosinicum]
MTDPVTQLSLGDIRGLSRRNEGIDHPAINNRMKRGQFRSPVEEKPATSK